MCVRFSLLLLVLLQDYLCCSVFFPFMHSCPNYHCVHGLLGSFAFQFSLTVYLAFPPISKCNVCGSSLSCSGSNLLVATRFIPFATLPRMPLVAVVIFDFACPCCDADYRMKLRAEHFKRHSLEACSHSCRACRTHIERVYGFRCGYLEEQDIPESFAQEFWRHEDVEFVVDVPSDIFMNRSVRDVTGDCHDLILTAAPSAAPAVVPIVPVHLAEEHSFEAVPELSSLTESTACLICGGPWDICPCNHS